MKLKTEANIALRYLRSKKKEGFASVVTIFSFIGIMLGVATLIVTMAVMNGVKTELINRIIGINAHISLNSFEGKIENYEEIRGKVENIEGVSRVTPAIYSQVLANINDENVGLMIRGIKAEDLLKKPAIKDSIKFGDVYSEDDFSLIAGINLSKKLGINAGNELRIISPKFNTTLLGNIPRMKEFAVRGIFDVGMYEYDSSVLFTSLTSAQRFLSLPNQVNTIEVEVKDPKDLIYIKNEILKFITEDIYITDWQKANAGFLESIDVQANVLFLILTLIILVAAFNVISGMVMLVNTKSKEVAILRTIGVSKSSVIRIFVICGSSIGILGTLLGVGLGLGFADNIEEIRLWLENISNTNLFAAEVYFLSQLPAEIRYEDIMTITIMSLAISVIATIYPAIKASNIDPATALKYE